LRLALANTIASVIVALLAPFIGAVADKGGGRGIRLLLLFTCSARAMTTAMFWVAKGDWQMATFFYIAASLGFWVATSSTTALLTDVAEERDYEPRLSTAIRSAISARAAVLGERADGHEAAMFGIADASEGVRLSFVTVGVCGWCYAARACGSKRRKCRRCPCAAAFVRGSPSCSAPCVISVATAAAVVPARVLVLHRRSEHGHQDGGWTSGCRSG